MALENHIALWRTRRETLVWLVLAIIRTGTVSLWRLAGHIDTRAQTLSVHRRFERFFQHIRLDDGCTARLIVDIMGLSGTPWHLALDRTNWKFGRRHVNILMLGVVHGNVCIPLFWVLLGKAGNSNARERIDLMARLREVFPVPARFPERGPGIHWRALDELVAQAGYSLCFTPEREHVCLQ